MDGPFSYKQRYHFKAWKKREGNQRALEYRDHIKGNIELFA